MFLPMMVPFVKTWSTLLLGNCLQSQFPALQENHSLRFYFFLKEKSLNVCVCLEWHHLKDDKKKSLP